MNLERAKELRTETASLVIVPPISLAYDFADPVAKLVAERIAVDAREAGITVQPYGESHVTGLPARGVGNAATNSSRLAMVALVRGATVPIASTASGSRSNAAAWSDRA